MHFHALHLAFAIALTWLHCIRPVWAQSARGGRPSHRVLKNSTDRSIIITATQRERAGLSDSLAEDVAVALEFEISNWANGSVADEDFYRLRAGTANAPAVTLLNRLVNANTSAYTLPPNTALSRFLFQTKTLNGSTVPGSAYILWPYLPRMQPDGGYPVIGWAHGTSGGFGNCAPSHIRNLWYQFTAPFTLALQGYVVVAPDYAGLGVDKDANNRTIVHQYLANPSHANDLFYSVQAAQSAFKVLSKQFIIAGHSQGGGAAWGAAQRQALTPVEGYLGSVAGSPVTTFIDSVPPGKLSVPGIIGEAVLIARGITSVFPEFDVGSLLTSSGVKRLALLSELQGCNSVVEKIFLGPDDFVRSDRSQNPYVQAYQNLTATGGRPIAGPLLVIQGEADLAVPFQVTNNAIDKTCGLFPQSQLEYATFAGVTHVPVMYAAQRVWLKWIEDRFAGVPTPSECHRSNYSSARPYQDYQRDGNWYIKLAGEPYEVA